MQRRVHWGALAPVVVGALATAAAAQEHDQRVLYPMPVQFDSVRTMHVTSLGNVTDSGPIYPAACNGVASLTDASFAGGTFILQGGFAQNETLAASYQLPASSFPIRIDLIECIFGTSGATQPTTTEWSVLVWEGPPDTGILVAEYSSDGVLLPHIELPPGTAGVNVNFSIDPQDPDQIFITNQSGTNTFSIGWRIDRHNNQTSNPCLVGPPTCCNAFPATDFGGLQNPANNWLNGVNCGPFGCPPNGGWSSFSALPSFCRPSGDWVTRATWTSLTCNPDLGACCLVDGTCQLRLATDCDAPGEVFSGPGTDCAGVTCTLPTGACCFQATGGCIQLNQTNCANAGGAFKGPGTNCGDIVCFPIGAVCLPDGSCLDGLTPDDADALGGVFQGDGTTCGTVSCPEPTGAACFPNGFCLVLTEAQALAAGATWKGPGSTCSGDANGNSIDDACEAPPCPADLTGEGDVNTNDFFQFLAYYQAMDPRADFAQGGGINTNDFFAFLAAYQQGC